MNVEESKQTDHIWKVIVSFYETYRDDNWDLEPQIKIVKRIAESEYASELYPHTSHEALCVSYAKDEESSSEVPMVCLNYLSNQQTFQVEYWSRPFKTHDLFRKKCNPSEVWELLESLFIRLKLESTTKAK